ncbi:SET and MYND domain-containing protein 4-like [Ischnura elegans]|uniref:SET and MYND domain-containing protein 4-like n=1 Tax=Ischnura elegans TaxID=197161 RepID=UPI001ED87B83|nr:SET and MYND domain-containing protein 4-like [Ischnura elegans]
MATQVCFSDFYEHFRQSLKREGCVEEVSTDFSKLMSDSERFNFVLKLMSKFEFYPSCLDQAVISKCKSESLRLKSEGNDAFVKGKEAKALNLYSRSALFAPSDAELSLAFANRSAVLAALKRYRDAVHDIERAISSGYPDDLKFKLMKRKAECLCLLHCHSEAQDCYKLSITLLKVAKNLTESKQKEIHSKLEASLEECRSHSNVRKCDEPSKSSVPTLAPNGEVPCASENVTICYDEKMGRQVMAAKYIDPGEVIAVEEPFASILLPEYLLSHCYHCLRRCWAMIPCRSCCHVMFCSEKCQEMSWNLYHEKECSILFYVLKLDMGKMAHLALRIVLQLEFSSLKNLIESINENPYSKCLREKGFSENGKYISSDYTAIYHLEGHSGMRYISDLFKRTCMAYCLVCCIKKSHVIFSPKDDFPEMEMLYGELILRHLQNLPCNAHEVSELLVEKWRPSKTAGSNGSNTPLASSLIEIGAAAYAFLSLINHSCDPNVVRHSYDGSIAVLRAIRPIRKGEQVLDNYGYHYAVHSLNMRRQSLREQYFFDCMCTSCTEMWPTYQLMKEGSVERRLRCPHCMSGPVGRRESLDMKSESGKSHMFMCNKCGEPVDVTVTKEKLASSSKDFRIMLDRVLAGQAAEKEVLCNHLILMDGTLVRPWKEYNDCQEALKHIFALEGNCFEI